MGRFQSVQTGRKEFVSTFWSWVTSRVVQTRAPSFSCATLRHLQNLFNDTQWLPKSDPEADGRGFVATDDCIILVTRDALDSGSERHQALMRRTRKRVFRFGKYHTQQCREGWHFQRQMDKYGGGLLWENASSGMC